MKGKLFLFNQKYNKFGYYRYMIKSITLLFLFIFLIEYKNMKFAICTMAKKENLYINEFIIYYEKLGIYTIFIYDDNDNNTERIKDIVLIYKQIKVVVFEDIKKKLKNNLMLILIAIIKIKKI